MKEYQQKGNGLVVVSPTSTSTKLSQDYGSQQIFFRTTSSTAIEGKILVKYAKKNNIKKIAIFRATEGYSESLTENFESLSKDEIEIVGTYNLDLDAINKLNLDEVNNADALAVFPNGQNDGSQDFKIAIALINNYLQNSQKKILGANSLFLWNTLNKKIKLGVRQKAICQLIVGVDWVFNLDPDQQSVFEKDAASLYYWTGPVNFRTALANDAVRVLAEAGQRVLAKPGKAGVSRLDIQEILSSNPVSEFKDDGDGKIATGGRKVSFLPKKGDRQEIEERILVTPVLSSNNELLFDKLEDAQQNNRCLQ